MATGTLRELNYKIESLRQDLEQHLISNAPFPPGPDDVLYEEEFLSRIAALEIERDEKIKNIAYLRLQWNADIKALDEEIKRLTARKKRLQSISKSLDKYCVSEMLRAGIKYVKDALVSIRVCQSPISAEYRTDHNGQPDIEIIDPKFVSEVVTVKVDRAGAIDHHKMTGEDVEGITFHKDNHHLVVR